MYFWHWKIRFHCSKSQQTGTADLTVYELIIISTAKSWSFSPFNIGVVELAAVAALSWTNMGWSEVGSDWKRENQRQLDQLRLTTTTKKVFGCTYGLADDDDRDPLRHWNSRNGTYGGRRQSRFTLYWNGSHATAAALISILRCIWTTSIEPHRSS